MKNYKRFPIQLSDHCIMLIHLFTRTDKLEDIVLTYDNEEMQDETYNQYKKAAQQLMEQLEGNYNQIFLKELYNEIKRRLK